MTLFLIAISFSSIISLRFMNLVKKLTHLRMSDKLQFEHLSKHMFSGLETKEIA
jgi:hypothetical protein